ncbi:hypothetical protein [Hyalangium versicolor]|uniref:hypothetical protein n=1 Tax=Hyalangium versicolor TaxID=2861190 RepID=UPI001CCD638F|nr:hypothetical protein [Hyalangium versicolor]
MQRLALAVRASELVPSAPAAETDRIRTGMAGDVPLRLSLREDGTLEVQAKPPHPLPEGMDIRRDDANALQIQALNPAMARRVSSRPDVQKRLQALFDVVPQARVTEGAVLLELPPEAKDDQLQAALRAAIRAASALSEASHALNLAAERNRAQVRSTAVPGELEGGRRFVKLLPSEDAKKPESQGEKETRVLLEARDMLIDGVSREEVLAHIRSVIPNPLYSRLAFNQALGATPRFRLQGQITALVSVGCMAFVFYVLYRLNFLGRMEGKLSVWIVALTAFFGSYGVWRGVGRFLNRLDEDREKDES